MTGSRMRFLVVILVLGASPVDGAQDSQTLTPEWTRRIVKSGGLLAVEANGRCVVVSENGAIEVLRPSGELWWRWPYRKISRYISPRSVAVAPECDAIAIAGSAGYRLTWIVPQSGKAVSIQTLSTPMATAFDRTGQLVAISTVSGTLQVHTLTGFLQSKRQIDPVMIVNDIEFSDDNSEILFNGGNVIAGVDGETLAFSEDKTRLWLRTDTFLSCRGVEGKELARIATPTVEYVWSRVSISRNFAQVIAAYQEPGEVWRIESYSVPKPCRN